MLEFLTTGMIKVFLGTKVPEVGLRAPAINCGHRSRRNISGRGSGRTSAKGEWRVDAASSDMPRRQLRSRNERPDSRSCCVLGRVGPNRTRQTRTTRPTPNRTNRSSRAPGHRHVRLLPPPPQQP